MWTECVEVGEDASPRGAAKIWIKVFARHYTV